MWIEIFKEGIQNDSQGFAHDGKALIDQAIDKFSAEGDTVPVVIGHPKTDSPAYGWVEKLKKESGSLWAKLRDLNPDFLSAFRAKTYPNRSAAFKDGMLRHIGFLGGVAPAVKGLKPVEFSDNKFFTIEFSESDPVPDPETKPETDNKKEDDENMEFSQKQMDAAIQKAAKEATDLALEEGKKAGITAAKLEFAEQSAKAARQKRIDDNKAWLKSISEGDDAFISPAQVKRIAEFSEKIADFEMCEFSEGEGKIDKTPLTIFQELIDDMKPENNNESGEFATQSRAGQKKTDLEQEIQDAKDIAGIEEDE